MKAGDYVWFVLLAFYALLIWFRDISWMSTAEDTLPILVALPLFVMLLWPWEFAKEKTPLSTVQLACALLLFPLGIVTNLTILLAISWTWLLWLWLNSRIAAPSKDQIAKLLILPFMAFPWITLDAAPIGWWFRLSGAWATAHVFSFLGANVYQDGTQLLINMQPIDVEVACSGLNTLQSMIIAGSVAAFVTLGEYKRYWFSLPFLVLMAWVANTIRIIILVLAALLVSPAFALGTFHTFGGWLVLMLMFILSWAVFVAMAPKEEHQEKS